jgi:hypothetical protein
MVHRVRHQHGEAGFQRVRRGNVRVLFQRRRFRFGQRSHLTPPFLRAAAIRLASCVLDTFIARANSRMFPPTSLTDRARRTTPSVIGCVVIVAFIRFPFLAGCT